MQVAFFSTETRRKKKSVEKGIDRTNREVSPKNLGEIFPWQKKRLKKNTAEEVRSRGNKG